MSTRGSLLLVLFLLLISLPLTAHTASSHTLPNGHLYQRGQLLTPPDTLLDTTFGGSFADGGNAIVEGSDGYFIVVGYSYLYSTGAANLRHWVVAEDGTIAGGYAMGGAYNDRGFSVVEKGSGGFVFAGETSSFGGSGQAYVIRTEPNPLRTVIWNKTFGGAGNDKARSVVEVSTGGFAVVGTTYSFDTGSLDVWLFRLSTTGNHLWNQTFGGTGNEHGYDIVEVSTGGFAIVGTTYPLGFAGDSDVLLIRTDASGNHMWNQTFGGTNDDKGHGVVEVSTGGFAIVGTTNSFGAGGWDVWWIRTNTLGQELWDRTYGGTAGDRGHGMVEVSDGGFAFICTTNSFGAGDWDAWLIRTSGSGNHMWNQTFGGAYYEFASDIVEVSDGGFVFVGCTQSLHTNPTDAWLVRVSDATSTADGGGIPGFPVEAIVVGVATALGLGLIARRRRRHRSIL